jgi:hypothetical protein
MKPGSMPEYGVSTSRAIRVSRTPGIGFMPKRRSTATWAWPPPTSTRSLTIATPPGVIQVARSK